MNKIIKTITLIPLKTGISIFDKKPYYEKVIAYDKDYPFAMFHIDVLYDADHKNNNEIYDELNMGRSVTCKITFDTNHD